MTADTQVLPVTHWLGCHYHVGTDRLLLAFMAPALSYGLLSSKRQTLPFCLTTIAFLPFHHLTICTVRLVDRQLCSINHGLCACLDCIDWRSDVCVYTGLQGSWAGRHQRQDDEPRSFQEQHIPHSVWWRRQKRCAVFASGVLWLSVAGCSLIKPTVFLDEQCRLLKLFLLIISVV